MKTFNEIYEELQNSDNNELNKVWNEANEEKKRAKRRALSTCLIIDLIIAVIFILLFGFSNIRELDGGYVVIMPVIMPLVIINLILYLIISSLSNKKQNEYKKIYKNTIINKIINNFFGSLEYFPEKGMPQYIYDEADYKASYNRYNADDYFEAQIGNKYSLQMGDLLVKKVETHRDSKGRTRTTTRIIFNGLFGKIIMDKSINSELRIMQNGNFFMNKERLKMDSGEFEKYFDVKATNQIIGMQLLTSDVMQELIEFQNNNSIRYDITIINNILYLRFHCGNLFEPTNIKNGIIDKDKLEKYFSILSFTNNLASRIINLVNETEI